MLTLNEIHHGCCLDLMQHIPSGSVDMVLCDLPYGTTACHWDSVIPFDKLWAQYERVIKPNGAIVLTASQPFTSALVMSNPKRFRHEWVWQKSIAANFMQVKRSPAKKHESVLVFGRGQLTYNPQMQTGQPYSDTVRGRSADILLQTEAAKTKTAIANEGTRYPSSIQSFANPNNSTQHPTQKPVALFEYLIRTYTNPGEVVLDCCIGSGTTAIAALNTGRQFIGIEQEEKYVQIGRKRIADRQPTLLFT